MTSHYTFNEPREVRIFPEEGSKDKQAAVRQVSAKIVELIGSNYLKNILTVPGGLQVHCSQKGSQKVHSAVAGLKALAEEYGVAIDVLVDGTGEILSFPPF
jgi:coenzyme F420-reducing hydrogenase alpha subunit